MRTALGTAIAVVTIAAWGGRIGLLTEGEAGVWDWIRIGGSLLLGLFTSAALLIPALEPVRKPALITFAVWSGVLWGRALIVNWVGDGSMPFKVVHTVLAAAFFGVAIWSWVVATES